MTTFEQNTNETIEKIVRNLNTMTNSIVDLYGKIEELNKSIERVKELTVKEEVPCIEIKYAIGDTSEVPCIMCDGSGCSFCNDTGKMTVDEDIYEVPCPLCGGRGYIFIEDMNSFRDFGGYVESCSKCNGTGKIKVKEDV